MSDLVDRLREGARGQNCEAADEIERLLGAIDEFIAENNRLRTALDFYATKNDGGWIARETLSFKG